ncbi:MAG: serine/threonine-protein kinase [Planctomycetota bacterium]
MNHPATHVGEEELVQLLEETLTDNDRQRVESHLETCSMCQAKLASTAGTDAWWNAASSYLGLERPTQSEDEHVDLHEIQSILAPSDDPRMMGRIGTYEIAGVVGSGATGIVVKALDPALNRFVALKLLRPSLAVSPAARSRFEREGRAAASIVHENVIAVHGVSEFNGVPYLAMPYIAGESLGARIRRSGPMNLDEILRVGLQVASGLAAAHEQGIVHRDVKPGNILLETGVERLKLTDFGLARVIGDNGLTVTGMLAGTPEYMSPEQAKSEDVDARSDLFCLGSVLWTKSVGRPPFVGDSCYAVIRKIVECNPTPLRHLDPRLPSWWQDVVSTLMQKSPAKRFRSANEVAETLRTCLAHVQDTANPLPKGLGHTTRPQSWKTIGWTLAVAIGLAVIGSLVVQPWAKSTVSDPPAIQADAPAPDLDLHAWEDGTDESLKRVQAMLDSLNSIDD